MRISLTNAEQLNEWSTALGQLAAYADHKARAIAMRRTDKECADSFDSACDSLQKRMTPLALQILRDSVWPSEMPPAPIADAFPCVACGADLAAPKRHPRRCDCLDCTQARVEAYREAAPLFGELVQDQPRLF